MNRRKKSIIIFLGDLQNSHFRYMRNSIPLGMGYVATFLNKLYGRNVDIHLFRKFEEIQECIKTYKPDLIALGSYCWNTNLTINTIKYVKKINPDVIASVGGADISYLPYMVEKDLRLNKHVDFYMPNEGELPTANLVKEMLGCDNLKNIRSKFIRGCLSINPQTDTLSGEPIMRYEGDINDIPSPYFDGLMDRFLDDVDYMPSIQTSRGCPYRCTYCVSGKNIWCKLYPFDTERVKAEIDYVAEKSPNLFMRFADENFGLLPRDVEIAEYLAEKKKKTGFPQTGSIYTDKYPTKRVKKILGLIKEIIPFCISFQSATPKVLEHIKRVNLSNDQILDAIDFARKNSMILVSELIFGLPEETVNSFLTSVNKLIEFRFESIDINPLQILKGTEMDTTEDREKYKLKTMFALAEKGYTKNEDLENIEVHEFVVATSMMSEEEYFKMLQFIFLLNFSHYRSFLKEFLFFLECYAIKASEALMEIINHPEICPILTSAAKQYEKGIRNYLKKTPNDVVLYVRDNASALDSILGFYDLRRKIAIDLLKEDKFSRIVAEVSAIGTMLFKEKNGDVSESFKNEIEAIEQYTLHSFIPIHYPVDEIIQLKTQYDFKKWIADNYVKPLGVYETEVPMNIVLKIRGYNFYQNIWDMNETNFIKYVKAFQIFTSANRRRVIETVDEGEEKR